MFTITAMMNNHNNHIMTNQRLDSSSSTVPKTSASPSSNQKSDDIKIISTSSSFSWNNNNNNNNNSNHDWWIDQVLEIQKLNHKFELTDETEMDQQGFVTVRHTKSDLQDMAKYCPQFLAIVVDNDSNPYPKVVGYTFTINSQALAECPNLATINKTWFDMVLDVLSSSESNLKDMKWVLGAQVCVSKDYRRKGLLQKLYNQQFNDLQSSANVDAIVTAVDHANVPSLKAHTKANFTTLKKSNTGGKNTTGWSLIIKTS